MQGGLEIQVTVEMDLSEKKKSTVPRQVRDSSWQKVQRTSEDATDSKIERARRLEMIQTRTLTLTYTMYSFLKFKITLIKYNIRGY